jgi:predicted enzyme related to lactoylglutathione lyase
MTVWRTKSVLMTLALIAAVGLCSAVRADDGSQPSKETKTVPKNPVIFWELASHDMEKSAEFFRKVFEWDVQYNEEIKFYQVPPFEQAKSASAGYIFTLTKAYLPFVTIYIQVEDIDAMAKKVVDNGGFIVEPPNAIAPTYRICLFNEPSGVTFAMIEPTKPAPESKP